MNTRNFITACAAALLAFGSAARAQFTDGAPGPIIGRSIPQDQPRSLNFLNEYDKAAWAQTPALDTVRLLREDSFNDNGPLRMGVIQAVGLSSATGGHWVKLADGGSIWLAKLQAKGALGLRLKITPWPLVRGAEFIFFNPNDPRETFGPFDLGFATGEPSFWTPNIYSDRVYIEYYLPPHVDPGAPGSQVVIDSLLNEYRTPLGPAGGAADELSCHLDVTCYSSWANPASGVGALSTVSNQFGFFCSGSMLNRIPTDFTPMFETATHCGITAANASTILVTWFFQTTVCNNSSTVPALNTLPQTLGSVLLAQDAYSDWTLVGLTSGVPGGVLWEGWDAGYLTDSTSVTNISHPQGTYKRIAFGTKSGDSGNRPATPPNCQGGTASQVSFSQGNGRIEPGSSGSPLFDPSQRVRGALSCGSTPTCTGTQTGTWGRLDQAWSFVSPYLVPVDPVYSNNSYGGTEVGTITQPFQNAKKGVFAVIASHNLYMQTGYYAEPQTIHKPMTIHAINGAATIGP